MVSVKSAEIVPNSFDWLQLSRTQTVNQRHCSSKSDKYKSVEKKGNAVALLIYNVK